jgi:hypothetical protein
MTYSLTHDETAVPTESRKRPGVYVVEENAGKEGREETASRRRSAWWHPTHGYAVRDCTRGIGRLQGHGHALFAREV